MSLAQGNNTQTRPRIEPGSPDPESDALTTRPVRPFLNDIEKSSTNNLLTGPVLISNAATQIDLSHWIYPIGFKSYVKKNELVKSIYTLVPNRLN